MDNFIFNHSPTQEDIDRAESERKMLCTLWFITNEIVDEIRSNKCNAIDYYLKTTGFKPSSYHWVECFYIGKELEPVKDTVRENWEKLIIKRINDMDSQRMHFGLMTGAGFTQYHKQI